MFRTAEGGRPYDPMSNDAAGKMTYGKQLFQPDP